LKIGVGHLRPDALQQKLFDFIHTGSRPSERPLCRHICHRQKKAAPII
jgi:hypothetical protein